MPRSHLSKLRFQLILALSLVVGSIALFPESATAHVKWFHDENHALQTELILSWNTVALILVSAIALGAFYLLQRWIGDRYWPHHPILDKMAIGAPTLLAVQAAVALIHAAVQPALFAPNLEFGITFVGLTFAAIQVLIALSFITGVGDWVAAIALILLGPIGLLMFPAIDIFEQLLYAGIGVFVLTTGRFAVYPEHARPWFQQHGQELARRTLSWIRGYPGRWITGNGKQEVGIQAITVLRFLTGISFIALGLGEKLWNMELAVGFLDENQWINFISTYLGIEWFDNELFAFAAGLTEATIGVLLVSGFLTRVVIIGMWLPFNLGLPFLPPEELLGHLPIFGIMYVLLVYNPHRRHSTEPREEPLSDPPENVK